jgi:hypothetical protein
MPRYFFNVRDRDFLVDKTGIELTGPEEAARQADELLKLAKKMLPAASFAIVVTDEEQAMVLELRTEGREAS